MASIKQDAKHFGYQMMVAERQKHEMLAPVYHPAKALLQRLGISQQNIMYYGSLVHYYTVFDLRRMTTGQSHLYLLCYVWQRYRQLSDNLVEAFGYYMARIEQETKEASEVAYAQAQAKKQREAPQLGRVLLLYVDKSVDDAMPFGEVRKRAFTIMPRDALICVVRRMAGTDSD